MEVYFRPTPIAAGILASVSYSAGELSSTLRETAPLYFDHVGHTALGFIAGSLTALSIARYKLRHNQNVEPAHVQKAAIIGGAIVGAVVMGAAEVPFITDSLRNLVSTVQIPLPGNRVVVANAHPPAGGDIVDVLAGASGALLGAGAIEVVTSSDRD